MEYLMDNYPRHNYRPRHSVFKKEDIFECLACEGMYTGNIIDIHLDECKKMPALIEKLKAEQLEAEKLEEDLAILAELDAAIVEDNVESDENE